jgi:nucleoside-diphosphate-sugar epimerase
MKILIIGASGYIGSHVAAVFADAGHEVSALRRPGGAALPAGYRHIAGDLAEPGSLTAAAVGYDRVIHAGAPSTTAPTGPGRRRCSPPAARCSTPPAPPSSAPEPRTKTA